MRKSIQDLSKELFKLMRPKQWFKSFSIFFGSGLLIYQNGITIFGIIKLLISFLGISLLSSSVYILNDLSDIEKDRLHPIKKYRPLASGKVSKNGAALLFLIIFSVSLILLNYANPANLIIGLIILANNLLYSFKPIRLKDIPLIDILSAGINFSLRVAIGWYSLSNESIFISIFFFPFFIAGFLLSCKRMGEYLFLKNNKEKIRKVFIFYNEKNLNLLIIFFIILSVSSYILFSVLFNSALLILTPWFLIQLLWYKSFLKEAKNIVKKPEDVFLAKKSFTISGILFCATWIMMTIFI
jgi:4-hydroxybenzoate polyprenyltransferase